MYWSAKLILIIFTLLLVKCDKKTVSLNSDSIDTTIEFKTFKINPKNTYTYSIDADSLRLSNSERLYAGFIDELKFDSYILLNIDLSSISEEVVCDADSLSSVNLILDSYNKLIEPDTSYVYIDTTGLENPGETGIKAYLGRLKPAWDNNSIIPYDTFDYSDNFLQVDFNIEPYRLKIDLLDKSVKNFCSQGSLDLVIEYKNGLKNSDIKDYLEIKSASQIFYVYKPRLSVDYGLLEEETVVENKFIIESISNESIYSFNPYVVNNIESDNWGSIYLLNSDEMKDDFALSDAISLDTISISESLGNIDFSIKVQIPFSDDIYYCQNGDDCIDGMCGNGKPCIATDNLPIALYLDDLIVYTDENDPAEDDWRDCGSDGLCKGDSGYELPDTNKTENNGIWDLGERYERNSILDWIDSNNNGVLDNPQEFLEDYDDFGFDYCPNQYENGNGGCNCVYPDCSDININSLYIPDGKENNNQYNSGELITSDYGKDGCFDEYEDGDGGCLENPNPEYSSTDNPDPNGDNFNEDPSGDNWYDLGADRCPDQYEDGDGGCNCTYPFCADSDINYGEDGCPDQYEDGNGGCTCEYPNCITSDQVEGEDPNQDNDNNNDNYNFTNNNQGTEGNGIWEEGEGTDGNEIYDIGENYFDFGVNGLPDEFEEFPEQDNWNDCGTDGVCGTDDSDKTESNGVWDLGERTEGNSVWDSGEPFDDFGKDDQTEYFLEEGYCITPNDCTENDGQHQGNEIYNDYGADGCVDLYEDGNGGCLEIENPEYDIMKNPDPNLDNYLDDINSDDWNDCGSDGLCPNDVGYIEADEDGSENNQIWNKGEEYDKNGIYDIGERFYDYGADKISSELEYLEIGNFLTSNIVHGSSSYIEYDGTQDFLIKDLDDLINTNVDVNAYFSEIRSTGLAHEAIISFDLSNPAKAIEFKLAHSPYIYTDSLLNNYSEIYYSDFSDSLINDMSIYPVNSDFSNSNSSINLNYDQEIQTSISFENLQSFVQDSTVVINNDFSNLYLYLNRDSQFYSFLERGDSRNYADIYYSDQLLKRIYFDGSEEVVIPIGNLIQKFINGDFDYNGFDLKLGSSGYNFNRISFYDYSNEQDSIFNPRIEIMYSK